jgi:dGTPase
LKYPWLHGDNPDIKDKWGAYISEKELFDWARRIGPAHRVKSLEADLMDWSDDVTYSVHDVDDFFRAGVIPLDRLVVDRDERERFYAEVFERRKGKLPNDMDETYLRGAFDGVITKLPVKRAYIPTQRERVRLRSVTSTLIGSFIGAVELRREKPAPCLYIQKQQRAEVFMLKQLTWHYVIKNPALATQQHGQTSIIRTLFELFHQSAVSKSHPNRDLFPISLREVLPPLPPKTDRDCKQVVRQLLDFISSLTEEQAVSMCHRMSGIALGSSLFYKVR